MANLDDTSPISTRVYPLHEAVINGKTQLAKSILSSDISAVNATDEDGRTPLFWAISNGNSELVSLLLNPNKLKPEGTDSKQKKVTIDIDQTDNALWTPLHMAVSVGNPEIYSLIANHDPEPDFDAVTSAGHTPLHYAISKEHYDIAKDLIVNRKCAVRKKDRLQQMPIHRAAAIGSVPLVRLLLNEGKSPVDPTDASGWTPLHHALAEGHGDVAVELMKHGADYKKTDSEGKTPFEVAVDDKVRKFFVAGCREQGIDL